MIDRGFCVRRDDFGVSLSGFVRGLLGVLRRARGYSRMLGNVFIPYTEGIYVFYGVKGVVKNVIFGVND